MAEASSKIEVILVRLVVVPAVGLILLGAIWYGFSEAMYHRVWRDILERQSGPMTIRFVFQPAMAAVAAIHDGINDARLGRLPYFWAAVHDRKEFGAWLHEGLISTGRIILLGLLIDAFYQHQVLRDSILARPL
jgi:hypothetical protein